MGGDFGRGLGAALTALGSTLGQSMQGQQTLDRQKDLLAQKFAYDKELLQMRLGNSAKKSGGGKGGVKKKEETISVGGLDIPLSKLLGTKSGRESVFKAGNIAEKQNKALQQANQASAQFNRQLPEGLPSLPALQPQTSVKELIAQDIAGEEIDPKTAQQIFQEAGRDPVKATQLARQRGFKL